MTFENRSEDVISGDLEKIQEIVDTNQDVEKG